MTPLSFTLQPLQLSDVAAVGAMGKASFANDRQTMVKTQGGYDHAAGAGGMVEHFLSMPERMQTMKAVANVDGVEKVLGLGCWGFRGYEPGEVPTLEGRGVPDAKPEEASKSAEAKPDAVAAEDAAEEGEAEATEPVLDPSIKRLEEYTDADMTDMMRQLMPPGTKCMFVVAMTVDPAYAGHGVGSALMEWGTKHADEDGVFCWVHASEGSHVFYGKHGFTVKREFTVDLDEFAVGPAPSGVGEGDGKWGLYTYRYMIRLPVGEKA